jgi:hypothetical protein
MGFDVLLGWCGTPGGVHPVGLVVGLVVEPGRLDGC